jgi:4-amino-4-deoxy-L-arabinose transferase-like glycosyltransferase
LRRLPAARHWLDLVLIVAIGALAAGPRLAAARAYAEPLASEERLYDRYAVPYSRGEGAEPRERFLPWTPLGSFTHRPPGYVLFLGVVYRLSGDRGVTDADQPERLAAVREAQAWLDVLSVMLLYVAGVLLFGGLAGRAVGLLAALAMVHYDFLVLFVARLLSETLFVWLTLVFLVLALLAARRDWPLLTLVAGYALGWANLVRTFLLFAVPGYLIWLLVAPRLTRRRWHILLATVGIVLAMAPVVWRNWQFHGQLILVSTNSGYTLYHGLTQVEGLSAPGELGSEDEVSALGLGEVAEQAEFRRRAMTYLRRHVEDWPRIVISRLQVLLAAKGGFVVSHVLMVTPDDPWLYPLVLIGALLSPLVRPRFAWHPRLLVWLLIGSQVVTILAAQAEVRYRLPLVPLLALLAAWTVVGTAQVMLGRLRAMAGRSSAPEQIGA